MIVNGVFGLDMNIEKLLIILILVIFPTIDPVMSYTITFEEPIPEPNTVTSQYSMDPNNFGVYFISPGRIFEPNVGTSSPTHALTDDYGKEFGAGSSIEIGFTTGQSMVSVQAGLTKSYPNGVLAHLRAYSSDKPGNSPMIAWDDAYLGTGPSEIKNELKVTSSTRSIKSVEIELWEQGYPGLPVYETIDDLTLSDKGQPSIIDTAPPTVDIVKPAEGQQFHNPYDAQMEYTAKDSESGVARIQVVRLYGNGSIIESYDNCGGKSPPCGGNLLPATELHSNYSTYLPKGVKKVRVNAWDYAGHIGQAERDIDLIPPGQFNLWAQGMEITQGTQPNVPINKYSRSNGTPKTSDYSQFVYYLPLVAKRTTVVRLYPGLEGTINNMPLDKVRAQLRCFIDPSYSTPFPGIQMIEAENIPPKILKEITVKPSSKMDDMQRDASQSWNFILPEEWTEAGRMIYLEACVLAPAGIDECVGCKDSSNCIRISQIRFVSMPDVNDIVYFVSCDRINLTSGKHFSPTQQEISKALNYFGRRFPIDETTLPTIINSWTWLEYAPPSCNDALVQLQRATATTVGQRKGVYSIGDSTPPETWPCAGVSNYFYAVGPAFRLDSTAHEIGHDLGLLHAGPPPGHSGECIPTYWCDQTWPWPHGTIGAFGFDTQKMEAIPPDTATENVPHDFMSYGGNDWVSPRTWIRIINNVKGTSFPSWP